jgi:hypothetical protein
LGCQCSKLIHSFGDCNENRIDARFIKITGWKRFTGWRQSGNKRPANKKVNSPTGKNFITGHRRKQAWARYLVRELAAKSGIYPASINDLYMGRGKE